MAETWKLDPDRCFSPVPAVRELARELYASVSELPIISPHGHVDPNLLADQGARFGNPAEFLIIPDHYVFRMLYSQGVPLEALGVSPRDGGVAETDGRRIWQLFADHFHLFRGTPTGLWLATEFSLLFGLTEKLTSASAMRIYDSIQEQLDSDGFRPRNLFRRFGIELLATTDAATDALDAHAQLQDAGFRVVPTFRPDRLLDFSNPGWTAELDRLRELSGLHLETLAAFIMAIENRRRHFLKLGATASDHSRMAADIRPLPHALAASLFAKVLKGRLSESEAAQLQGHMLFEMARMSSQDGLVMQLHLGSYRNHNQVLFDRFGPDTGSDIPVSVDWTRGLSSLLNAFGNEPGFRLILFTLDEATYGRELAPLAGHYPAVRIGPPWWFFDSVAGMERYLDQVVETAGFYNLAGFNDDTRAFASIPARHDVWRRVTSNWLAGQVGRGLLDRSDALEVARWLAYDAAKSAYRLDNGGAQQRGPVD